VAGDVYADVGFFQADSTVTSPFTQDLTISGATWTAKACLLFISRDTTLLGTAPYTTNIVLSAAMYDGTSLYATAVNAVNGSANADVQQSNSTSEIPIFDPTSGAIEYTATIALITGGVRVTWRNSSGTPAAPPADVNICLHVFGGTDFNAKLDSIAIGTTGVDLSITGAGFQPNALLCMHNARDLLDSVNSDFILNFGVAADDNGAGIPGQASSFMFMANGSANMAVFMERTATLCVDEIGGGTEVEVQSFDSDGVTFQADVSGGSDVWVLMLDFDDRQVTVGTTTTPADTTTNWAETGVGFQPQYAYLLGGPGSLPFASNASDGISLVGAGENGTCSVALYENDAAANSQAHHAIRAGVDYRAFTSAEVTFLRTAGLVFDADGWDVAQPHDAAIASLEWAYLAVEEPSAGGPSGSGSPTGAADTSSAAGISIEEGAASPTGFADTSAASGISIEEGTASPTGAADTSTASGTSTESGSASPTGAADTATASGTNTESGAASPTGVPDTLSAAGESIESGSAAPTGAADTSTGAGISIESGAAAATEAADTAAASGTVGDSVSGSAAPTGAADTSTASGTNTESGSASPTGQADTSAAAGVSVESGSGSPTGAADTSAASGAVGDPATGSADPIGAADTSTASGVSIESGGAAPTGVLDTSTAAGVSIESGAVAATEAADTSTASGSVFVNSAVANALEAADTSFAVGLSGATLTLRDIWEADLTDYHTDPNSAAAVILAIKACCDQVALDLAALDAKVDTVDAVVDGIASDVTSIESKIDTIDTLVDSLTTTVGAIQTAVNALPNADTITDSVWDELLSAARSAGSYGERVQKLLTQAKFLSLKDV
jgi:hypothetical protein